MRNRVFTNGFIAFIALVCVLSFLNAATTPTPTTLTQFNTKKGALGTVKAEILVKRDTLGQYFSVQQDILTMLKDNNEDMRENIINSSSLEGALSSFVNQMGDTLDGVALNNALNQINQDIEDFINTEIDENIYQRWADGEPNEDGTITVVGYNQAFDKLQEVYENLSDDDRTEINDSYFNNQSSDVFDLKNSTLHMPVPSANAVFVQPCNNPSGRCYGYYTDPDSHKETCPLKHGTDGTTNKTWWSCFDATCTYSFQHWIECRALCGVFCPPPTSTTYFSSESGGATTITEYYDHEVTCTEEVYSIFNGILNYQATCGRKYFTCQGACQHNSAEGVFPRETQGYLTFDHAAKVVTTTPYQSVTWHLKHSSYGAGLGATLGSEQGDGSKKMSSLSYTFTDEMHSTGTYTVTAVVAFATNSTQYSYTVYVYESQEEDGGGDGTDSGSEDDSGSQQGSGSEGTTPTPEQENEDDDDDPPDTTTTCPCGVSYDPMVVSDHNTHRLRECRDCDNEWRKCISPTPPACKKPWRQENNLPCRPLSEN